jgi:hypothetical protein
MCRSKDQVLRVAEFKSNQAPSMTFPKTIDIADVNQLST